MNAEQIIDLFSTDYKTIFSLGAEEAARQFDETINLCKNVIQSCANDTDRNCENNEIENVIENYSYLLRSEYGVSDCAYHAKGYNKCVPGDRSVEDGECFALYRKLTDSKPGKR